MIYTALYGSIHYLDKWEGVCAMKIENFLGPVTWQEPIGECHLGPKKVKIFRAQTNPLPLAVVMDAARIKRITHGAV
jgi:hypothetical protein